MLLMYLSENVRYGENFIFYFHFQFSILCCDNAVQKYRYCVEMYTSSTLVGVKDTQMDRI